MKKIFVLLLLTISFQTFAQMGWIQQRAKVANRDSVSFVKDARFAGPLRIQSTISLGGITITANGAEINILDGVLATAGEINHLVGVTSAVQTQINAKANTSALASYAPLASPNFTTAARLAGDSLMKKTRLQQIINDSIQARILAAQDISNIVWKKTDTGYTHKQVITYDQLMGFTGGGSGSATDYLQFIVGTTTGSPANGDSTLYFPGFAGKSISLSRGTTADLHRQTFNNTSRNIITGYRVSNDTIIVRPAYSTGDRVLVEAVNPTNVSWQYFTGGANSLLTSLKAWWSLDESTGVFVNDSHTGNFDGGTLGQTGQTTAKRGYSELFTRASAQWANFGTSVGDVGLSDFSIAGWLRMPSLLSLTQGTVGNTYDYPCYYTGVLDDNSLVAKIGFTDIGGFITLTSSSPLSANTWYHFALTCDRSGNALLYLNGSQVDSEDISSGVAVALNNNNNFAIGSLGNMAGYTFNGYIDEVGLWTKILSPAEVLVLAGATKSYPF